MDLPGPEVDLRRAFVEMAEALPPFSLTPGALPAGAQVYLDYYGLDMQLEFPGAQYRLGNIDSGTHRLALQCWTQHEADSTLLLVHGYFDHVGLFSRLVQFGLSRGSNVVAFDLPGHGLSSGAEAEIEDFSEYAQAIADVLEAVEALPGRRQVIAQSAGAAALMEYLYTKGNGAFSRVVLLAPLVRPHGWGRIKLAHGLLHRFVKQVARGFADNSQDPEFLAFVRGDPLQSTVVPVCWITALKRWLADLLARPPSDTPLLVLQGDDDGTVDWRFNLGVLREKFPAATIAMIPGGRHHLANEDQRTRARLLQEIERYFD